MQWDLINLLKLFPLQRTNMKCMWCNMGSYLELSVSFLKQFMSWFMPCSPRIFFILTFPCSLLFFGDNLWQFQWKGMKLRKREEMGNFFIAFWCTVEFFFMWVCHVVPSHRSRGGKKWDLVFFYLFRCYEKQFLMWTKIGITRKLETFVMSHQTQLWYRIRGRTAS